MVGGGYLADCLGGKLFEVGSLCHPRLATAWLKLTSTRPSVCIVIEYMYEYKGYTFGVDFREHSVELSPV